MIRGVTILVDPVSTTGSNAELSPQNRLGTLIFVATVIQPFSAKSSGIQKPLPDGMVSRLLWLGGGRATTPHAPPPSEPTRSATTSGIGNASLGGASRPERPPTRQASSLAQGVPALRRRGLERVTNGLEARVVWSRSGSDQDPMRDGADGVSDTVPGRQLRDNIRVLLQRVVGGAAPRRDLGGNRWRVVGGLLSLVFYFAHLLEGRLFS